MEITLRKADLRDAGIIHELQVKAFMPLLEKYQDFETSPANEPVERVIARINQPSSDYYLIHHTGIPVGGIRVVKKADRAYRISPVFIIPDYQGRGIAQRVFARIEQLYPDAESWELDTILQEAGNCYLYEKVGYKRTDETKVINDRLTLVFYEKHVNQSID
ncbi:GNAT family N-acetyltransferase [Gorillibacterium sp. sgz500922]|uniref:GNAT family N-acetyltransferase n=1 Tax=Gorillibacterium sp. sgz500922 TaxID=3446694 RepID=UPI003F67F265